jgi:hypothetical protein
VEVSGEDHGAGSLQVIARDAERLGYLGSLGQGEHTCHDHDGITMTAQGSTTHEVDRWRS